jgi:hypothetical protein
MHGVVLQHYDDLQCIYLFVCASTYILVSLNILLDISKMYGLTRILKGFLAEVKEISKELQAP